MPAMLGQHWADSGPRDAAGTAHPAHLLPCREAESCYADPSRRRSRPRAPRSRSRRKTTRTTRCCSSSLNRPLAEGSAKSAAVDSEAGLGLGWSDGTLPASRGIPRPPGIHSRAHLRSRQTLARLCVRRHATPSPTLGPERHRVHLFAPWKYTAPPHTHTPPRHSHMLSCSQNLHFCVHSHAQEIHPCTLPRSPGTRWRMRLFFQEIHSRRRPHGQEITLVHAHTSLRVCSRKQPLLANLSAPSALTPSLGVHLNQLLPGRRRLIPRGRGRDVSTTHVAAWIQPERPSCRTTPAPKVPKFRKQKHRTGREWRRPRQNLQSD